MASNITLTAGVRQNLLSLQSTADLMATTQNRLATGKKVNSALDNPTNFFTSSALHSRANDMAALLDGMATGIKTLEAADNGLTSITKAIESMQSTLRQARQDKSFQTKSYDVTDLTQITVSGGAFGTNIIPPIELQNPQPGTPAELSSSAAYAGPTFAPAGTLGAGAGGRAIVAFDANMAGGVGDTITVNGNQIDLSTVPGPATIGDVTTAIGTALGADYVVSNDGTSIIIEDSTATGAESTPPVVSFSPSGAATPASATFSYDPARMGATITVDGNPVTVSGDVTSFGANLQTALGNGYQVSVDTVSNEVTVASTAPGAGTVNIGGLAATPATTTFTGSVAGLLADDTITVNGAAIDLTAATDGATIAAEIETAIGGGATVSFTGPDQFSITYPAGAQTGALVTADANVSAVSVTDGFAATTVNSTPGIAGATVTTQEAAVDEFSLTYDNKTAAIKVGAGTETERALSINNQLKAAGIENIEASFEAGSLVFTAKNNEAKALTITGPDAAAIFGTSPTNTGTAPISPYNATQTVDKFVEEINRTHAGNLRASNDNGKLRIENLSTQELSVSVDKDGSTGPLAPSSDTIDGNKVRANLVEQFNVLRDQLDRLSDDASYSGVNLLRGDLLKITFNETGTSTIEVQSRDLDGNEQAINTTTLGIEFAVGPDFDSDASIDGLLDKLTGALGTIRSQASNFGTNLNIVENRTAFTKAMMNTLQTGADSLVLADTNEEAANMLALQTRQQLSSTALSLATQADQAVMRLFG